ncbi:TetR family transcriptional regulator C-terminal domain-containing protein [Kitasatospora sp. NPDC054939]
MRSCVPRHVRARPELRSRVEELQSGMDSLIVRALEAAEASGGLLPGLDPAVESRRLSALLDGLTVQAVLQPERIGPEELRAVLRRHLDSLARPRPQAP